MKICGEQVKAPEGSRGFIVNGNQTFPGVQVLGIVNVIVISGETVPGGKGVLMEAGVKEVILVVMGSINE